jgi:hypothetical protein
MLKSSCFRNLAGAAILSGVMLLAASAQSHAYTFKLTINLSGLAADSANGPFSLDVGMGNGATFADSDNTITLNNFVTVGGSFGAQDFQAGGASGAIGTGVTLTNSTADNELEDLIGAGVTSVSFLVTETNNNTNPAPDSFFVELFDGSNLNAVATTDPSSSNTLVFENLGSTENLASVQTFSTTAGSTGPGVSATAAVPEPASTVSLLGGLGILGFFGRKTFRRKANA